MRVICELFGAPAEERPRPQELTGTVLRSDLRPEQVLVGTLLPMLSAGQETTPARTWANMVEEQRGHLAFGDGPHFCRGAPLTRLEEALTPPAPFERFPGLSLAVDPDGLVAVPSLFSKSSATLPVLLGL
ncbi:hypothetical protein ACFWVP_30245 [Streptomyces sp. NPDC058637]|uniref:hypothetical protein n=1 Tax=Streptomyces sp. NPDC058637 TaxID=3346569 RepID=UPI0036488ABF